MQVELRINDRATPYLEKKLEEGLLGMAQRLQMASSFLLKEVQKNCEPSPNYPLKTLRKMGHPYAKRWYSKGSTDWTPIAGTPAEGIHDPIWQVNRQTSQLRRDLSTSRVDPIPVVNPAYLEVRIGVPESSPAYPYARHVIYGTKRMVPRNFIANTMWGDIEIIRGLLCRR